MPLFHMHSDTLQGFYASDVYVADDNKAKAIGRAMWAYDAWVKKEEEEIFNHPLIWSADPDDPEYPDLCKTVRKQFLEELRTKLEPVPLNATILRKT